MVNTLLKRWCTAYICFLFELHWVETENYLKISTTSKFHFKRGGEVSRGVYSGGRECWQKIVKFPAKEDQAATHCTVSYLGSSNRSFSGTLHAPNSGSKLYFWGMDMVFTFAHKDDNRLKPQ